MCDPFKEGANLFVRFSTLFALGLKRTIKTGVLCTPFLFLFPPAINASEVLSEELLTELSWLSDEGAETLSFMLLAEAEPNLDENPQAWSEWHQKKIELLRQKGRWQDIIQEYETLPVNAPDKHHNWVFTELVKAYLAMGGGDQARDLLMSLIWDSEHDQTQLADWRRLVIQSYLVDGRFDDAQTAILRYEQDYQDAEQLAGWLGLKARLLIESDRANDAALLTVVSDQPTARSAYVLARLNGLSPLDTAMLNEALTWVNQVQLDAAFKQMLFSALFEKTKQISDLPQRIAALESLLEINNIEVAQTTAVADALWHNLTEYGQQLANQQQLLVGNFGPWFDLAAQLSQSETNQSEALYAWLAIKAEGKDINAKAHAMLVNSLDQQGRSELLRSLYLSSSQFSDIKVLPLALMYRLIDLALAVPDLAMASRLMSQVDAPAGVDVIEWQLRRARVQILAGVPEHGADLLREIVAADSLTNAQIENLLLAVQDLNNKTRFEEAFSILADLLPKVPESAWRYELFFWMAEARMAQQQYSDAARLYLRSAKLAQENQSESWSLTAHQRAAFALEQAGLLSDAVNMYQALLPGADNATRSIYENQIRRLKTISN